jgi:hypothetical protein
MSTVTGAISRRWHAHRYLNLGQLYSYKVLFAHLGKFIIAAIYFILLQTMHGQWIHLFGIHSLHIHLPYVKQTWDSLLSKDPAHGGLIALMTVAAWTSMRHIVFRGLMEGVLGMVLFNQIGFNVEKYDKKIKEQEAAGKTKLHWYNRFFPSAHQGHPVTALQYAFLPILLLLITTFLGVPLYLGLHYGLAQAAHLTWLEPHISAHASIWKKIYVGEYDGLLIGIAVGIAAKRTYRPYLYANTKNYGRSWVARGHKPHWWMPKPTRELIHDLQTEGIERQKQVLAERHRAAAAIASIGALLSLGLAVFGYFVISTNGFTH